MKLVIVESPAKCAKIQSYLGDGYKVVATMGHIRALQESLDSVGIDRNWEPTYAELAVKRDAIVKLKSAARGCEVILASDDDREGESIAWHVCHILKLNPATTPRIVFHEITKPAILAAAANPRTVDMAKVHAQQARAMLDLLVGFTISKVLWNRVAPKLSAGRCQSPALRLVVERDAEVEQHHASAFWRLSATLQHPKPTAQQTASKQMLVAAADAEFQTRDQSLSQLKVLHNKPKFTVITVKETVSTSNPPKPLITSTLQQEASSMHGLNPKVTMQAAQKLYEAGHITYMRTDNPVLSQEAATTLRAIILTNHGADYVGTPGQHTIVSAGAQPAAEPKKKKKLATAAPETPQAQAAHEAIRPTHPELTDTDIADATQRTVYRLIARRAMQSQMSAARTDVRKASFKDEIGGVWTTEQTKTNFLGYRVLERQDAEKAVEEQTSWTGWATVLQPGAVLSWSSIRADEHFTKPKGRYTEASLIADLEKRGIGRPSTFASLVSTILDREYVEKTNVEGATQESHHIVINQGTTWKPVETTQSHKVGAEKNKMRSTPLGRSVSEFLHKEYNDLFAYEFTARMESDLDAIAQATKPWKTLLQDTWDTYKDRYNAMTTGGSAVAKAARERVLADGLKVILSKKGPLFVRDPPAGSPKTVKATFASLLSGMQYDSVTAADAERAFAVAQESRAGELLGAMEDGQEIRKKKGPYGFYADCGVTRVPLRGGETLEQIVEKIKAKCAFATTTAAEEGSAYERKLGDYMIKRGPYGLYFYKHTLKRVTFVTFPKTLDPDKVVVADMAALYSDGLTKKKRGFKPKDNA